MNVSGMNNKFPDDSGTDSVSVAGKNSNRQTQTTSIMDLGKPDQSQAATSFRRHFDEVVRANTGASRGNNSLHENTRSINQAAEPAREVIDRAQRPQKKSDDTQSQPAEVRQQPVDDRNAPQPVVTQPDQQQQPQTQNSGAADDHGQPGVTQGNQNKTETKTDDQSQDVISLALAGLAAVQVTAPVSPVQEPSQPDAVDQVAPTVNTDTAGQAADILTSAIVTVSEALGMKVSEGVYHLDLKQPGDSDVKEIADILSSLKAISSILDTTAATGETIEIKGSILQGKEISQLDDLLHQAVFKIEAAVNLLGISQSVSSAVAENLGVPGMQGIAVAMDPADKNMPSVYVDRVQAMSAKDPQQTIQGLIERLTSLLRDAGSDNQASKAATASLMQRMMNGQPAAVTTLNQVNPLDSSVMRVILKVDGAQATSAENKKAANQSEKMDLPKTQNIVMGRNLLDGANVVQDNSTSTQDGSAAAKLLDLTIQPATNAPASARAQQMPARMDQSVVTQLVQNFSSMLKIGSHEVRIMLHPRELGDVHLSVKIIGDEVVAKIQVENQQVKQIVESNLQSLKSTLAEHNLKTSSFSVEVNTGAGRDLAEQGASHAGEGEQHSQPGAPVDSDTRALGNHESASGRAGRVEQGHDTGRRYGNNSFEFYA